MFKDHIAGFELSDEVLRRHVNEANSLHYLQVGLDYLYQQVQRVEQTVRARMPDDVKYLLVGNDPVTSDAPKELVTCSFHWYAVSACNFVKLVGWVRHNADPAAPTPDKYVEAVLPEVLPWRNKIAAHFARTFPTKDKRDSEAEREASILAPIGFSDDAFYASPTTLHVRRGGQSSDSSALQPWSLTKVHEQLVQRYWPNSWPVDVPKDVQEPDKAEGQK